MHSINLSIHVVGGILAIIAGLIAVFTHKGGNNHVKYGNYFLLALIVVIFTALIGVFAFSKNTFLLVITLLSGYTGYGGYRVMRLRNHKPFLIDYLVPLLVLFSGIYYLYYITSIGLYWSPIVIYSTLSALALVTLFDLAKIFIPLAVLNKTRIYEHVYKLSSSLTGLLSAFVGTVLPQYQPYSQVLPSVIGLTYIMITFIYLFRKTKNIQVSAALNRD